MLFQYKPLTETQPGLPAPSETDVPPQWRWVTLRGPDAQDFLHRITSVNVKELETGRGAPGCFLTAQGRIRSFFHLWCLAPGEYGFELDAGRDGRWLSELQTAIDQYTFAEKMTLNAKTGMECAWFFSEGPEAGTAPLLSALLPRGSTHPELPENGTALAGPGLRICNHGRRDYGRYWMSVWGSPSQLRGLAVKSEPVSLSRIESWRIGQVRPRVDFEITDAVLPLEVGMPDAIASNKGGYPGQEVIEKIVSLGSPARRLVRIEGQAPIPLRGTGLKGQAASATAAASEVGHITSIARDGERFTALALVRKTHAKEGTAVSFAGSGETGTATVVGLAPYQAADSV